MNKIPLKTAALAPKEDLVTQELNLQSDSLAGNVTCNQTWLGFRQA